MAAENGTRKLVVEICNANNLMPKDGQGTASAYAIVDFDGQRRRTKTKFRDLNPVWDEKLEFMVHDIESMESEMLEINLYNDKKIVKRSTFLGKIKLSGSLFVKSGEESLVYYPLEKRSVFSQVKGEIGVKVYYIDEEVAPVQAETAADQKEETVEEKPPENEKPEPEPEEEKKVEEEKASPPPPETSNQQPQEAAADSTAETNQTQEEKENQPVANKEEPPTETAKDKVETGKSTELVVINDQELRSLSGDHNRIGYDLVDRMPFLYVRVIKAKVANKESAGCPLHAKLIIGTHNIKTKTQIEKDWDQVFAFDKEVLNSSTLEVSVWIEEQKNEEQKEASSCLGTVSFDLQEVPKRVPPDSPLAPQWYSLESESDTSPGNDVMIAVWFGTQADEVFQEAWQSDSGGLIPETRAKVYLSPKLWYLRLTVIRTQDLQLDSGSEAKVRSPELYVKAQLGAQLFKTSRTQVGSAWNEDLVFVAAEPFEPFLLVNVEDASHGKSVGEAKIHVSSIDRRIDDKTKVKSRWFNLIGGENKSYAGRIHVRVCLEGGYHVTDEAAHVTSDVRPTAKQLAKPPIGLLDVGIRGASNLLPVKTKDGTCGTTDAYVVAKYGPKWIRTRTILDRFNPRWNEQYTWDIYDPCTVLTICVFDNGRYKGEKDVRIGKIRIRLSTLDTNTVYQNSYTLTVLSSSGAKKMGEVEIAVRFCCSSWLSLMQAYGSPMLPRMHHISPLGPVQQETLRHTAMRIVTNRLAKSEPALGQEVIHYILDTDTHLWSMRRSKANWFRVVRCLSCVASLARWLDEIRTWTRPSITVLVHGLLVALVLCPHLVLPTIFLYAFFILVLRFRYRRHIQPNMDSRLSYVDVVSLDELDEEFDEFPTTKSPDTIRMRYDRLRAIAGRTQTLLGDVAVQGERLESLFSWRDPRASGILVLFCLFASLFFYLVPFKVFVLGLGFYYIRHPRFRDDMPSLPINFFRRLPSLSDQVM